MHFLMFSRKQTHLAQNVILVYSKLNGRKKKEKTAEEETQCGEENVRQVKGNSSILGKLRKSEATRLHASIKMFHFFVCAYQLEERVGKIMSAWEWSVILQEQLHKRSVQELIIPLLGIGLFKYITPSDHDSNCQAH